MDRSETSAKPKVITLDSTDSTNRYMSEHGAELAPFTVIRAVAQDAGRGRLGRGWVSTPGKDLAFSILLPLDKKNIAVWQNITQVAALALCSSIEHRGVSPKIKWPNDVLINNRKVAGILCEVITIGDDRFAVLGMGVNVNSTLQEFLSVDQPVTSLLHETGSVIPIEEFVVALAMQIISDFITLMSTGFDQFLSPLRSRLAWQGQLVTFDDGRMKQMGVLEGIASDGTLLLKLESGSVVNYNAGDIMTVRKVS